MGIELTASGGDEAISHILLDSAALSASTEKVPLGSGHITAVLGRGGMAAVYEIWNPQLEMFRAVKVINPNCSEISKQRFQTEIKITAKLQHPNIIEIHAVGEWNGLPYIEMEKIDGVTLDKVIQSRGALHAAVCTAIGIMISRALAHAHSHEYTIFGKQYHGVIHRDLKPSNIMIRNKGEVKLMDFGIARPADASFMTIDESITGTLQYLSPEQLERKSLDVRTDIYSLGTTLYEAVTGEKAFPESSFPQLIAEKTKNRFLPLDLYDIKIPRPLRKLIHKCMQHDPDKRVQTAQELLALLEKIHGDLTPETPQQVLQNCLAASGTQRVVIATRRRIPVKTLIGLSSGLTAGALALYIVPRLQKPKMIIVERVVQAPRETGPETKPQPIPRKEVKRPPEAPVKKTEPVVSEPPEPKPQPPKPRTPKPEPFIEALRTKYDTDDLPAIMQREWKAGNHATVLQVYDYLDAAQSRSKTALIYKLRALVSGRDRRLGEFLASSSLDDAEFHLARARLACDRRSVAETERHLEKALRAPHEHTDYEVLKQEVTYLQALCATIKFDDKPSEGTYKEALDAWWQLRAAMRSRPEHEYNRRAVSETQRIGEKYRTSKG